MAEEKITYKYRVTLDVAITQDELIAANSGQAIESVKSILNSITAGLNEQLGEVKQSIVVPENGIVAISE